MNQARGHRALVIDSFALKRVTCHGDVFAVVKDRAQGRLGARSGLAIKEAS
jgi:hypothetical protein